MSAIILTPLTAPTLERSPSGAHAAFYRAYERYGAEIAERKAAGPSSEVHQRPVRLCAKREALRTLLLVKRSKLPSAAIDTASDDALLSYFRSFVESVEPVAPGAFEARLKKLRYPADSDPRARIDGLVSGYARILEECGRASLITDSPKLAISHLTEALRPPALKHVILNRQREVGKCRKDFDELMTLLNDKVVTCEEFAPLQVDKPNPQPHRPDKNGGGKGKNGGRPNGGGGPGGSGRPPFFPFPPPFLSGR